MNFKLFICYTNIFDLENDLIGSIVIAWQKIYYTNQTHNLTVIVTIYLKHTIIGYRNKQK